MIVPGVGQAVLLLALGGTFVHFTIAGGRTFYSANLADEPGALVGQFAFLAGGVMPAWYVGLNQLVAPVNGIAAVVLLACSLALYEWSRHVIWNRRFGLGWGDHVPEALCEEGPYRRVRHPLYASYLLAYASVLVALPHWLTLVSFAGAVILFTNGARHDERVIAGSALAADYVTYRKRAGMFLPRVSRSTPGR
jgi:protein-S-isoprenylcysteine O-methyltransferase Ste14